MKTLKEPVKEWNFKFTCVGCNAELEADDSDIIYHHYDGSCRDPSYSTFHLQCPHCQEQRILKQEALPKLVILNVKDRYNKAAITSSMFYDR